MHPETFGPVNYAARIVPKYSKKSSHAAAASNHRQSYSPAPRKSSKGPSTIIISGITGFHSNYNGEYVRDASAGKVNDRMVYRRVRAVSSKSSHSPGPGQYNLAKTKTVGTDGKRAVFAGRHSTVKTSETPGPSRYDTRGSPVPRNGLFFGLGERGKNPRSKGPGPGAYYANDPQSNKPSPLMVGKSHQREPLRYNGVPGMLVFRCVLVKVFRVFLCVTSRSLSVQARTITCVTHTRACSRRTASKQCHSPKQEDPIS